MSESRFATLHCFEEQCARALPDIARDYTLPDGETISVSPARSKAPEMIFSLTELSEDSFDELRHVVNQAIRGCDIDLREMLLRTVVLVCL